MEMNTYDKFEYMSQNFSNFSQKYIVEQLNTLGKNGWEYCKDIGTNIWLFKRKIYTVSFNG